MSANHVEGKKKGDVFLYALSTCIWCKKTKRLLNDLGIAYDYVDVDLLGEEEKNKAKREVKRWNPKGSYPTIVINGKTIIHGFDEEKIREVFENE